jgi:hypothetical protein
MTSGNNLLISTGEQSARLGRQVLQYDFKTFVK